MCGGGGAVEEKSLIVLEEIDGSCLRICSIASAFSTDNMTAVSLDRSTLAQMAAQAAGRGGIQLLPPQPQVTTPESFGLGILTRFDHFEFPVTVVPSQC